MAKAHLRLVAPATVKRTVSPRRLPNRDLRTREHLTEAEVERLMEAAKGNRHGPRDATLVLVAYRHGLRASELVDLRWGDQVDFRTATLHVRRSSRARPARIPLGTNSEHSDGSGVSRRLNRPLSSRQSGERPSRPLASPAWSSARVPQPSWPSRPTLTC